MDNKREQIKKIKSNPTLSENEKNIQIQNLMMGNYSQCILKSNESKTCSHYEKSCYKFYFDCCNVYDPCKRCHVERNCINKSNLKVQEITCSQCGKAQEPGEFCSGCGIKFSNSYCSICQIWTVKDIVHCVKCGLCRLGKSENIFHCDDCGTCFNKNIVGQLQSQQDDFDIYSHKCIGQKFSSNTYKNCSCVICSENIFDSQITSFPLTCGHFIHNTCFNEYIQQGSYKCPYCKKSIGDLSGYWNLISAQIKLHPLPGDFFPIQPDDIVDSLYGKFQVMSSYVISGETMYKGNFINWNGKVEKPNIASGTLNSSSVKKNLYKQIHCNDCGIKSTVVYHPYGLECVKCNSFNTQE